MDTSIKPSKAEFTYPRIDTLSRFAIRNDPKTWEIVWALYPKTVRRVKSTKP